MEAFLEQAEREAAGGSDADGGGSGSDLDEDEDEDDGGAGGGWRRGLRRVCELRHVLKGRRPGRGLAGFGALHAYLRKPLPPIFAARFKHTHGRCATHILIIARRLRPG